MCPFSAGLARAPRQKDSSQRQPLVFHLGRARCNGPLLSCQLTLDHSFDILQPRRQRSMPSLRLARELPSVINRLWAAAGHKAGGYRPSTVVHSSSALWPLSRQPFSAVFPPSWALASSVRGYKRATRVCAASGHRPPHNVIVLYLVGHYALHNADGLPTRTSRSLVDDHRHVDCHSPVAYTLCTHKIKTPKSSHAAAASSETTLSLSPLRRVTSSSSSDSGDRRVCHRSTSRFTCRDR